MPEGPWQTLVVVSTLPPIQSPIRRPALGFERRVAQAVDQRVPGVGQNLRRPFDAFLELAGWPLIARGPLLDLVVQEPGRSQHAGPFGLDDLCPSTFSSMSSHTHPQNVQVASWTILIAGLACWTGAWGHGPPEQW